MRYVHIERETHFVCSPQPRRTTLRRCKAPAIPPCSEAQRQLTLLPKTLLLSKNSHESHLQRIVECTRGIAFMGTPHCGADKAKWGSVLGHLTEVIKTTNTNIVDLLQPDSEVLARIQQEFAAMLQVRQDRGLPRIKITCFYECLPTTVMLRSIGEVYLY